MWQDLAAPSSVAAALDVLLEAAGVDDEDELECTVVVVDVETCVVAVEVAEAVEVDIGCAVAVDIVVDVLEVAGCAAATPATKSAAAAAIASLRFIVVSLELERAQVGRVRSASRVRPRRLERPWGAGLQICKTAAL